MEEWKEVVGREKTKFKMKIIRGEKKVKWGQRKKEQNMKIEIKCKIKSSDFIMHKLEGQEINIKKLCNKDNIANHGDHSGFHVSSIQYLLVFFFLDLPLVILAGDPVWTQAACVRPPGIYCLWLTPSVVNLVTLDSVVRSKHHRWGRVPPGGTAIASPQAAATQRGLVFLSKIAAALWGMTQHQDPCGYSLSSLPKTSVLSLSSSIYSQLCPHPISQSPG